MSSDFPVLTPAERIAALGSPDPDFLSDGPNSLADPDVREQLVRAFYATVANLRGEYLAGTATAETITPQIDAAAERLQAILYGQDPNYTPVAVWNNPEHLGRWLVQQFHMTDDGPEDAVRALLVTMAADLMVSMAKHEAGEWTLEDIQTKADGMVDDTMDAIIGSLPSEG